MLTALIVIASVIVYLAIGAVVTRLALNAMTDDSEYDRYELTTTAEIFSFVLLWPVVVIGAAAWYAIFRPLRNFVMAPLRRRFEDD